MEIITSTFHFRGRLDLGDDTWGLSMAAQASGASGAFWCLQLWCTNHSSNTITLVDSQVMLNGIYGGFSLLAKVDSRDMLTTITIKICKDMYSLGSQEFVLYLLFL